MNIEILMSDVYLLLNDEDKKIVNKIAAEYPYSILVVTEAYVRSSFSEAITRDALTRKLCGIR